MTGSASVAPQREHDSPRGGAASSRWKRALRLGGLLTIWLLGTLAVTSCHLRPMLYDVSITPAAISPNGDGTDDVTSISYRLSRNALLSIYFVGADGARYFFRQGRHRTAGQYRVQWGGGINQPRWIDMGDLGRELARSWVLPDGAYTWVVEATDEAGRVERKEGRIDLAGGDTVVPELGKFTVTLPVFTPNQDGLDDRTGISYYLSKEVESVQVYLSDPAQPGARWALEEKAGAAKPGEAGLHYYDYDGGVDRGADPPRDGRYIVTAEARDRVGHHVEVSSTLTISTGGKPRALVVQGEIDWGDAVRSLEGTELYLPLGATLVFTTYVENYGPVPIRTSGPPSGTFYRSDQNFNTLAEQAGDASLHEQAGVWRFGIRFDVSNTDFPYRWAVGRPEELRCELVLGREQCFLDPGKRATVSGAVQLVGPFPREAVYAWGALIHEYVGINAANNYVDRVLLHIGHP